MFSIKDSSPTGLFTAAAFSSLAIVHTPLIAQESEVILLEEVIVTARNRAEALSDVPVSISAFTGDELKRTGMDSLTDLTRATPGVNYDSQGSAGTGGVVIRGLAQPGLIGDETNVAVFIDGVYVSGRDAAYLPLGGIERVEVVRGPQSAIYGRNAFSGAVNYITQKPVDFFTGEVKVTAGSDRRKGIDVGLNIPLTDWAAMRIDLTDDDSGSTHKDTNSDKRLGGHENEAARVRFNIQPTDNLEIDLTYSHLEHLENDQAGFEPGNNAGIPFDFPTTPILIPFRDAFPNPADPGGNWLVADSIGIGQAERYAGEVYADDAVGVVPGSVGNTREVDHIALTLNWSFGDTLWTMIASGRESEYRAITGYDVDRLHNQFSPLIPGVWDQNTVIDEEVLPIPGLGTFMLVPIVAASLGGQPNDDREDTSIEVRVASNSDSAIRWSVGAFEAKTDVDQWLWNSIINPSSRELDNPYYAQSLEYVNLFAGLEDNGEPTILQLTEYETETSSAFAQVGWDVNDNLTLNVEGRWTDEDKTADNTIDNRAPGFLFATGYQEGNWSYFTPRFTADYHFTDDRMVYINIAKGVKSGGFNGGASGSEAEFDPEENITYEVGAKFTAFDGQARFELATYFIDWSEQQIRDFATGDNAPGALPAVIVTNLGETEVTGFEFNMRYQFAKTWGMNLAYTYSDVEIVKGNSGPDFGFTDADALGLGFTPYPTPQCLTVIAVGACAVVGDLLVSDGNLKGNQLPQSPKTMVNLSFDFVKDFGNYNLYSMIRASYKSEQFQDLANAMDIPAHTIVDFTTGLETENWRVTLSVDNVFDEDTPVTAYRPFDWTVTPRQTFVNRDGRMYSLSVVYEF